MDRFTIQEFVPLSDAPLDEVVSKLRAVNAVWKSDANPLKALQELRRDNEEIN